MTERSLEGQAKINPSLKCFCLTQQQTSYRYEATEMYLRVMFSLSVN